MPNLKCNHCVVYRHLRENGADCAIYRHKGGGGGGEGRFLFPKRLLMTLVIYVLINVEFKGDRLKKLNILRKVNENCNFCSHLLENQLRHISHELQKGASFWWPNQYFFTLCSFQVPLIKFHNSLWTWAYNNYYCTVPEKIHTHPMEDHRKFLGGVGLKSQNFRSKV